MVLAVDAIHELCEDNGPMFDDRPSLAEQLQPKVSKSRRILKCDDTDENLSYFFDKLIL